MTTQCSLEFVLTSVLRNLSATITEAERDTAVTRLELYRQWFSSKVMQVEKYDSIVVIPIENISPRYRDDATCVPLPCAYA